MEDHIERVLEWHLCISEALAKFISGEKYQKGNRQCSSGKFHKIGKKKGGEVETPFLSASLILERVNLGEENDADVQRYEKTGRL